MTKEKVEDLIKRATPFIGMEIHSKNLSSKAEFGIHKFIGITNISSVSEQNEAKNYSVSGRFASPSGKEIYDSLELPLKYFETLNPG